MNANDLWAGGEYAYTEGRGRGVNFVYNALRVRVIKVTKQQEYGNKRMSAYAEVQFLEKDTGEVRKNYGTNTEMVRKVRARDIFARWDDYENDLAYREREKVRLESERIERQKAEEEARTTFTDRFVEKSNIPRLAIQEVGSYSVTLSRSQLEQWLNNGEEDGDSL